MGRTGVCMGNIRCTPSCKCLLLSPLPPSLLQVLADVYEYWLLKRRRHGRPLVRSLQIPTSLDNQDPLLTFRWGYWELLGVTGWFSPWSAAFIVTKGYSA